MMNILRVKKLLTLKSFDTSSEAGRSDERYRLAALSILSSLSYRGTAMIVMVLTVTLTIPYLGAERFGVWMTVASFTAMLSFLDLGVGNALANRVSQVAANGNQWELRQAINGGLGFLFVIGCLISILLLGLCSILPWDKLIKVQQLETSAEVKNAVNIFSILFGFSIFSNGIQRIFAGLQQAFFSNAVSTVGSIVSLLFLWWATKLEANIPYLLISTLGVQLLSNLGLLIILKKRNLIAIRFLARDIKFELKHLCHAGALFFILQIGTIIGWGADSIIIASTLGASQVAVYSIVQRLYLFISQPLSMMNGPLWNAYADAHARGDKKFIKNTLKKSLFLTITFSIFGGGVLFLFSNKLIEVWTHGDLEVPPTFVFVFFVWTVCETLGSAFAMMLNGCGVIREQVITVVVLTTIALPLKLIVINHFGMIGMQATYAILYCVIVLFFYGYFFRDTLMKRIEQ